MRPFQLAASFTVLCALIAAIGCATPVPVVQEKGEVKIDLDTSKKRGTSAKAQFGNRVTVIFPVADLTAYQWQISSHDVRFLKQLTEMKSPEVQTEGATMSFLAVRVGSTRLRFVLVPVGKEREATPIDGRDLILAIQ